MKFRDIIKNIPDEEARTLKNWKRKSDILDYVLYGFSGTVAIIGLIAIFFYNGCLSNMP